MSNLSEGIADFYVKRNIIQEDEKSVYEYGIKLILNDIFTFSLIIVISALFWRLRYAAEFLLALCLTRIYCGGFHAKTACVCKLSMIFTFLCVMIISDLLKDIGIDILILILTGGFIVTVPFIPVAHPNKNMSERQKRRNKALGIVSYLFFSFCSCVMRAFIDEKDGIIIALSLCAVTVLVIIGTLFNCREVKS